MVNNLHAWTGHGLIQSGGAAARWEHENGHAPYPALADAAAGLLRLLSCHRLFRYGPVPHPDVLTRREFLYQPDRAIRRIVGSRGRQHNRSGADHIGNLWLYKLSESYP